MTLTGATPTPRSSPGSTACTATAGPCCSDADGTALSDIDWESVNDPAKPTVHYRVRVDGEWWDVTDDAVLTQPNLYGRTMVWPVRYGDYANGQHRIEIRCFIPGSMM